MSGSAQTAQRLHTPCLLVMCDEKQQSLWGKTANPRLECDTQTSSTGANHWLGKMGCQMKVHKRH